MPRALPPTAATADKYTLYQAAVQSPEVDTAFLARIYRGERGREPLHFREDFCGTGLLSSHWIRRSKRHTAEGFDLDPEPVRWGLIHNFRMSPAALPARLPARFWAGRYLVHLADVRAAGRRPPDVRVAQNFSYWVFKRRAELLAYFRAARSNLARDGVFVIDLYGGPEAQEERTERRRLSGFTYVWDQVRYWPGTGDYTAHIHFEFRDGTALRKAFRYDWRLWHLGELEEALLEVGFGRVDRYFEGSDESGRGGNGIFRRGVRGENCDSWLAYLVAWKSGAPQPGRGGRRRPSPRRASRSSRGRPKP